MHQSIFKSFSSLSLFDLVDVVEAMEERNSLSSKLFAFFAIYFILIITFPLLKIIFRQCPTFNCFLCVGNSILIFKIIVGPLKDPVLCLISAPYGYLSNLLNRLLSSGILINRFVLVFKSDWVPK